MLILCRQKKKTLDFSVRFVFNPITSRGDYHAISPFGIHILSSKQVVRILKLISYKLLLDWTPIQFTRKCVTARGEIWQSDLGSWRVNWAIFFFFTEPCTREDVLLPCRTNHWPWNFSCCSFCGYNWSGSWVTFFLSFSFWRLGR